MAAAVRERVPVAERARAARVFVAGVSGAGHWGGDDAGRPGELPGTSVRHGRPGQAPVPWWLSRSVSSLDGPAGAEFAPIAD